MELCWISAAAAALALGGALNGWLDLLNALAPFWIVTAAGGAGLVIISLPKGPLRRVCLAAGVAAAVCGLAVIAGAVLSGGARSAPAGVAYRIVTSNVFHDNASPFSAARALLARGADALIVEEADGNFVNAAPVLKTAYPYSATCPLAGVRIWLKTPILANGCEAPPAPTSLHGELEGFAWVQTLGPDHKPLTLIGVHLARPYPPRRQDAERAALARTLRSLKLPRPVLAGDLNLVPWSFAMRRLEGNLAPLRRWTVWPATYPAQININQVLWRLPFLPIDHMFGDSHWTRPDLKRFRVTGSDHFALQADALLAP